MRILPLLLFPTIASICSFGQPYTIDTIAGGGLPVNTRGTSAILGDFGAHVAVDRANTLYFTYQHSILRLDGATGMISLVAGTGRPGFAGDNGPAINAQLNSPAGLAFDSAGNLYFCDVGNARIRKISDGTITTVAGSGSVGFGGDNGPANRPVGTAIDPAGNLYFADSFNHRIRKISGGVITTVAGTGTGGFNGDSIPAATAELNRPIGMALDRVGDLYVADSLNHRVRKIANGVITTAVGTGEGGSLVDNIAATRAIVIYPEALSFDPSGNLYVADIGHNCIRKVSNGIITTVAGNGTRGFSGDGGPATSASLDNPWVIALDSAGNLFISDDQNHRIRKVANGTISTVVGSDTAGFNGDNGPATNAQLGATPAVAVDTAGNLYFPVSSMRVLKVSNGVVTAVAGNGVNGSTGDGGLATNAALTSPLGIAVDVVGNIVFSEAFGPRVRKIANGVITTVAGNGTSGFSGDNGPAINAQFQNPWGLGTDNAGNLFVADAANARIRKISNGIVSTIAGNGTRGFGGDNGPATQAQFVNPQWVALDSAGNLYVSDLQDSRVRKVSNGIMTTVAGSGAAGYSGDNGPAYKAQLQYPGGIAADSAGNLYIADTRNHVIRKVSQGVITTIAGNGTAGFSGDGGPATAAQFAAPNAVAVDAGGNVYVADAGNMRIRVLRPAGVPCSYSVTPASLSSSSAGGTFIVTIHALAGCPWIVSGLPDWITLSAHPSGAQLSTVTLSVSPNTRIARTADLSIAGTTVQLMEGGPPTISPGGILNTASSAVGAPLSPGSIATAYGTFPVSGLSTSASLPLPLSLAGLSVQFDGRLEAPLYALSSGQVNFQLPWELAGLTRTSVSAVINGQTTTPQTIKVAGFSPGIFSTNAQGTGQGAILDSSYRLVDRSNPASAGHTVVQIYCTGLGAVTNQPPSGSPASAGPLSMTVASPRVTIGGVDAPVLFSGLAPGSVGEYQVNALVPMESAKGSAVPVVITIGGTSSNAVTIAIQ